MIELLAPAKNKICAKAAIDCGADAIYIGASDFGARKNASNSIEDIKEIVEYAHQFNVKVYIAINTIFNDNELIKAKELVKKLAAIEVDAFIIQDMGLFESIKKLGISPHASTQCNNRSPEKVKFLENVGFTRVILARELSIEQIREINQKTNVELEAFIHGALCVSYSGQCYLSYAIGGRSANRGECAQPCRKKYSLMDEEGNFIAKDKYLLCLKDFNVSKHIKELANAGVTSFKIEGRLKDENYVKNVVAYYRKLIDELAFSDERFKKTSSGNISFDFEPHLEKSFNRNFTNYFIDGKRKEIFNFDSPKACGEYLGKVEKVGRDFFEIKTEIKKKQGAYPAGIFSVNIYPQDGLCFFDTSNAGELKGCLVNKVEKAKIYPNKMEGIKSGIEIYRNFDAEFEKNLKRSKTCRKISADIEFKLGEIKVTDEDGVHVYIKYNFEEFAQNEEKMKSNIVNQLKKSGESIFLIKNVSIIPRKIPFLTISKLNELRRDILEKLLQERLKSYHRIIYTKKQNLLECIYPEKEVDYKANILNKKAKEFYERHNCKVIETALEDKKKCSNKVVMTTKHCLKSAFNLCKSNKKLYLIDEKGKRYNLKFNCNKCEMEIIFTD